jgi:HEXXH motif-containing protein
MSDAQFPFSTLFCPDQPERAISFPELAASYYQAVTNSIIQAAAQGGRSLDKEQFRLSGALLNNVGTECWMPELGYAFQLANQGGRLIDNSLAQLALCNARLGKSSDLNLPVARGSYLIAVGITIGSAGYVELRSDHNILEVKTENIELKFARKNRFWECVNHPELLRRRIPHTDITVTSGNCLDPELVHSVDPPGESGRFDDAVSEIAAAMSLIREKVPQYGPWCERFLRHVHVIGKHENDVSFSRSAASRPGYVVASAPMPVALQAEMLVHECTHQYYFLLELLTRVPVDPESRDRYYSPLAKRERPLERVLVAYHAAANMAIFHSGLLRTCPTDGALSKERLSVLKSANMQMLETISRNAQHLTVNANAFWQHSRSLVESICG